MKSSKATICAAALLVLSVIPAYSAHAGPSLWPQNKGEINLCNTKSTDDPADDENIQMAVMRTLGSNYIVQGTATDIAGNKSLFSGNAVLVGNLVLMHVTASGLGGSSLPGGTPHGFVGRVELSADSLTGWTLGVNFNCETSGCSFDSSINPSYLAPGRCN